jgi:uncharacterized protein (TIGR03066 family)
MQSAEFVVKKHRQSLSHSTKNAPAQTPRRSMRRWLAAGALFLIAGGAAYLATSWLLRTTLPDDIVGEWRIEGGEMNGSRVSYARDGTFKTLVTVEGKEVEVKATVQKDGDTLRYTIVFPDTGKVMTRTQTIKSLTASEIIVEENRQQSRLVRIGGAR